MSPVGCPSEFRQRVVYQVGAVRPGAAEPEISDQLICMWRLQARIGSGAVPG